MCGRFTLRTPLEAIAALFNGLSMPPLGPRYNIAPTQQVLAVREDRPGDRRAVLLRWGLVPSWSKDPKSGFRMINARGETVASKPSFRAAFKNRRCLVVADGFYEWKKNGSRKQPYYIRQAEDQPFCFAGLWERWQPPEGDPLETCTIITTNANESLQTYHERMPVILSPDKFDFWLDPEFEDRLALEKLLVPCDNQFLKVHPVSTLVNKPTVDTPQCIARVDQGELF